MRTLFVLIFFTTCVELKSQERIFDSNDLIRIDIVADLHALFKDVNPESAKYHSGFITYIGNDGKTVKLDVKLRTRGVFRRSRDNCNLPPLTIKFINDSLSRTAFSGISKLKLVNSCSRSAKSYQQFVVKEYLAYRIYNTLTEYSFKVRFVKIVYIDINSKCNPFESFGFLIEDMDGLSSRTASKRLNTQGIVQEATNRSSMDITAMFQFMIGNTDWSVPKLHNIKLVVPNSSLTPIAIPFDFDFCGFVNPPYTKPPEIIPIKHVTDRYYRGYCRSLQELEPTINVFLSKKNEIYNLLKCDTLLSKKQKLNSIKYIDEFYENINSQKYIKNEFIDNCRKE